MLLNRLKMKEFQRRKGRGCYQFNLTQSDFGTTEDSEKTDQIEQDG